MSSWKRVGCEWTSGMMPRRRGQHVLVYHSIVDAPWHDPYEMTVSATRLAEQVAVLARGRWLASGAVSLTFDDGFADNVTIALPILTAAGVHATLFVVAESVDREAFTHLPPPPPGRAWSRPASWAELKQWAAAGLSIGLHGWRHEPFTTLDEATLRAELIRGKRVLEERLGVTVDAIAYPYGDYAHVDAEVARIAGGVGFTRGYTAIAGPNVADTPPLLLHRIRLTEWDDAEFVERKADGRFDFYGTYQWLRHRLTARARG